MLYSYPMPYGSVSIWPYDNFCLLHNLSNRLIEKHLIQIFIVIWSQSEKWHRDSLLAPKNNPNYVLYHGKKIKFIKEIYWLQRNCMLSLTELVFASFWFRIWSTITYHCWEDTVGMLAITTNLFFFAIFWNYKAFCYHGNVNKQYIIHSLHLR